MANALGKDPKQFKEYQAAVKAVEIAAKGAGSVLDRLAGEERYGWLRGLAVEGMSVQPNLPSGEDCHLTIVPVCKLRVTLEEDPGQSAVRLAGEAVTPTLAASTVTERVFWVA